MNPFQSTSSSLNGPARDIQPVVPDDASDLPSTAIALYVEIGGTISFDTVQGATRTVELADYSILPVGVLRVRATGTTAAGIHALVLG